MEEKIFLITWILSLIILLALTSMYFKKKIPQRKTNYYNLFILGIFWILLGLFIDDSIIISIGTLFIIISVINKEKWKSNRIRWKDFSREEKEMRLTMIFEIIGFLIIGFLITILVYSTG